MKASGRGRGVVALAAMLSAVSPRIFALNPALDASQYAHASWKIRGGLSAAVITPIAQTPAGHHGLPGMRERAKLAGGILAVQSRPRFGTEVDLTIRAALAFTKSDADERPASTGKGT